MEMITVSAQPAVQLSAAQLLPVDDSARTKTPVVFLHGLVTGNMAGWYFSLASPLSAQRPVILYDQRGHGSSSVASAGYDLDSQVADLAAVIAHYTQDTAGDAAHVCLVGHSMGALIALHFALKFPQQVEKLVLVDAPVPANTCVGPSLRNISSPLALEQYLDSDFSAPLRDRRVQDATPPKPFDRRRARQQQRLEQLFFNSSMVSDVLAIGLPDQQALAQLAVPTLLVYGKQSPCADAAHWLQQRLPHAQTVWLDCGHYVPSEAPAELLAIVQSFLASGGESHD